MVFASTRVAVLGSILVLGTFVLTLYSFFLHIYNWREPLLQKLYCRIIILTAVYCVGAFLVLMWGVYGAWFEVLTEGYEAYCIFVFVVMIVIHCGGEGRLVQYLESQVDQSGEKVLLRHMGLVCRMCCPPFATGYSFIVFCRFALLQFVVWKPVAAAVVYATEILLHNKEHHQSHEEFEDDPTVQRLKNVQLLMRIITVFSVVFAFYALLNIFKVTHVRISAMHPLSKFSAIKILVFLTIVQKFALSLLVADGKVGEDRALEVRSLLITLEMFLFSIVFLFAFSIKDFAETGGKFGNPGVSEKLWIVFALHDIVHRHVDEQLEASSHVKQGAPLGDLKADQATPLLA